MRRPENNRSLANAGSGGVDEGRWALMLACRGGFETAPTVSRHLGAVSVAPGRGLNPPLHEPRPVHNLVPCLLHCISSLLAHRVKLLQCSNLTRWVYKPT